MVALGVSLHIEQSSRLENDARDIGKTGKTERYENRVAHFNVLRGISTMTSWCSAGMGGHFSRCAMLNNVYDASYVSSQLHCDTRQWLSSATSMHYSPRTARRQRAA